jgi:type I restriction enzyme, R subunit
MTAGWEHFAEWKKINDEGEEGVVSLETIIRGVCEKARLLDLIENFTIFSEAKGETAKLVAKNHQYLGVNRAIGAVQEIKDNQGKLGVFWHTQGSGKSYSMVFFSQKVLRKLPGHWTFLIITDRDDLDGQIYRNFASTGAVIEPEDSVRAQSAEHLKTLLNAEDHRYLFTLIQKFRTEKGEVYPKLSDRSDIIVITDEAHRSQYDAFALNMRNALPNAAFIGFTGTPLMAGEELTKQVFGDYVSVYNFKQSIDDGNTVPLYYENRIPELQLVNENLGEEIADIVESADLDEDQQAKLEREFAREYHLITREERLEKVAEDIVAHYSGRGVLAKAMVITIDKATAVKMYDKVQKHWNVKLADLRKALATADAADKPELERRLSFFEKTDMAVVVSQSQNELEEFKKKGLDIGIHRKRMVKEDLETKFKNPDDPLRIVFVCAMWITGFDVPSPFSATTGLGASCVAWRCATIAGLS